MSNVLVVNAGSSSLKLRILGPGNEVIAATDLDKWDGSPAAAGLAGFCTGQGGIAAVGHRVVHGGSRFTRATLVDDSVLAAIAGLADLAPLPGVPNVACFDTAFHAGLSPAAATYALPADWTRRFGLRRYGFHGLSHAYAARRAAEIMQTSPERLRLVTCHLGAGSSLAAVAGGRCADTTMGFTPLEGLVMATRCGSVDPGLLVWLLRDAGLSLDEVAAGLEFAGGLAGLAGLRGGSGDMRDVASAARAGSA